MRRIELTRGKSALVSDRDYERVVQLPWAATCIRGAWYAVHSDYSTGKRKTIYMHRFILDAPDDKQVDHINNNGLDNRRENLRICTNQQNHRNRRAVPGSASRYKGVNWYSRDSRWRAAITIDGQYMHLGYFDDEDEAARAYNEAAQKHFGRFAFLNDVPAD